MRRKYPKTTGYYVYVHITPDEMFYIGMSKQQPCDRWNPSTYKNKSLGPYIEKYGWDNIKHVILKDGLTEDQALVLECLLIDEATRQSFCINNRRSGGIARDNRREYMREYNQRPEVKERKREYNQRPEVKEHKREYNHTDKYKEYQREYYLKKKALKN